MTGKWKKILILFGILGIGGLTVSQEETASAEAKEYTVTVSDGRSMNGELGCGYFELDNGAMPFCAAHELTGPKKGMKLTLRTTHTAQNKGNETLRKVLYYGLNGVGDIGYGPDTTGGVGQDKGLKSYWSHYRRTALAVSVASGHTDNYFKYGQKFINYLKDRPAPPDNFVVYVLTTGDGSYQELVYGEGREEGEIQLQKVSQNKEMTDNNGCYALEGAEFGVYRNYDASTNTVKDEVGRLVVQKGGVSNVLTLDEGTYYVKEQKAPKGFSLSTEVKKVTVTSGKKTEVTFEEPPLYADVDMLLQKADAETNENAPQDGASFLNAQFTIKFYPGLWEEGKDPASLGKKAARTWVFKTDEHGAAKYDDAFLVNGDPLFKAQNGDPVLPLGTITVQETKAPKGYLLNDELFVLQIETEKSGQTVKTYHPVTVPENILRLELLKKQEGSDVVIPGAEFEHTKPDGTKEKAVTDKEGRLDFRGLEKGRHTVRETKAPKGYLLNENTVEFEVTYDNKIQLLSEHNGLLGNIRFEVEKEGVIEMEVEDKLLPYELTLHKKNDEETPLAGAEFTLFKEKECKNVIGMGVTNADGTLVFQDLNPEIRYYLKETKAPEGYRIPTDAEGKAAVYEIWATSTPAQGVFAFYLNGNRQEQADITIINRRMKRLPETGYAGGTVPILMSGGILILLAVKQMRRGEKR